MQRDVEKFFDTLKRKAEFLEKNDNVDNEAFRHDLLIRPLLTNPCTLGWKETEIIPQMTINIPVETIESYYWKKAAPKKRRPDILIKVSELDRNIAVIEEKEKQNSLDCLKTHLSQVKEYQNIFNVVWALLTDGQKWILQRNMETLHVFSSLDDLKKGLGDLRNCIGRSMILERLQKYNCTDMVIVIPSLKPVYFVSIHGIGQNGISDSKFNKMKDDVRDVLQTLSSREELVLRYRFGIDSKREFTIAETAGLLGISNYMVRKLEKNALNKLKNFKKEGSEFFTFEDIFDLWLRTR